MITKNEYQKRRQQLASRLPANAIAIIPAAKEVLRNGDAHYRFRQNSHFYYLTGFSEPEASLVILTGAGKKAGTSFETYLFNQARHPQLEQWTGKRLGQENAPDALGVDEAFPIETYVTRLPELCAGRAAIYYPMGHFFDQNDQQSSVLEVLNAWHCVKGKVRRGIQAPDVLQDLDPLISEMRLFKSAAELQLMRQAMKASIAAHYRAMSLCNRLENEAELESEWMYGLFREGCREVAYTPIVGSGANACILHYTQNDQAFQKNDLVLVDAGGEFENYAADITRTFPVKGQFTPEQRLLYELVLNAQRAGIACVKPGVPWNKVQVTMVDVLIEGLMDLGLLTGSKETLRSEEAYKPFYMHGSGHWLGLDVHDAGQYKQAGQWRAFEPGMILTVEPGLYIQAQMPGVDERWWNIGIRIEDNILVTPTGCENLTASLPVEVPDIEAIIRG